MFRSYRSAFLGLALLLGTAGSEAAILNYGSFLGGGGNETAMAVAVGPSDELVSVGWTDSSNFPVPNGLQPTVGAGQEAFVAKFNATNQLQWSTYIGGANSGNETADAVAIDGSGRIYVAGGQVKEVTIHGY